MPIRINLLAEAKAAEEQRRHDPVKRVIFCGAFLVALALVWSSSIQLESMLARTAVTSRQTAILMRTNDYQHVVGNQQKINEAKQRLGDLNKLSNRRFLQGNLLNALQQIHVNNVQLTRLKVNQSYTSKPASPPVTTPNGKTPGAPGAVTEKIVVSMEARDSSASPGDQVNKMKDAVANHPFFKALLSKTNGVQLINLSAPQLGLDGKSFVLFTLECDFQEITR
jgi:hypothetical protein